MVFQSGLTAVKQSEAIFRHLPAPCLGIQTLGKPNIREIQTSKGHRERPHPPSQLCRLYSEVLRKSTYTLFRYDTVHGNRKVRGIRKSQVWETFECAFICPEVWEASFCQSRPDLISSVEGQVQFSTQLVFQLHRICKSVENTQRDNVKMLKDTGK